MENIASRRPFAAGRPAARARRHCEQHRQLEHHGFKGRCRVPRVPDAVARDDTFQRGADRRLSFVIDKGTPIDLSQGMIERTGNPLDVAVQGRQLPRRPDAAGRALHPRRLARDQWPRPTRHQAGSSRSWARAARSLRDDRCRQSEHRHRRHGQRSARAQADRQARGRVRLRQSPRPRQKAGRQPFHLDRRRPARRHRRRDLETGAIEKLQRQAVLEMTRLIEVTARLSDACLQHDGQDRRAARKAITRLADQQPDLKEPDPCALSTPPPPA
jgi:flagellar basal-body rod protein FlgF